MRHPNRHTEAGFSLIEALVAVALAALLVAALLALLSASGRLTQRAELRHRAIHLAETLLVSPDTTPNGTAGRLRWHREITSDETAFDGYQLKTVAITVSSGVLTRPVRVVSARITPQ